MLTVAYCQVSTEEQAAEGYSIEGQAEKARTYATLRDLGPVTMVSDPGWSARNLDRPGMQELLAMVERGAVSDVIVWRVDRISRDVGDLAELVKRFERAGVRLHSVMEGIDAGSATRRMQLNILGTFAQYFREQLSENVRMG